MQSRTVPGLQLFSSMPKMPQNKQRVQSATARKEAKLRVWNLTFFYDQCIPESRLIQTPQVCVRFSFNFRHWLILFHQPTAISQRLGL